MTIDLSRLTESRRFKASLARCFELILGAILEIAGCVALVKLLCGRSPRTIDYPAALHCGSGINFLGPPQQMGVGRGIDKFCGVVEAVQYQSPIPRPDRNVSDRISITADVWLVGQLSIEHIHLAFGLHGEAIDRIFEFWWVHRL